MTIRKIAQIGHPVLRQKARIVEDDELKSAAFQALIDDMIDTMRDANGAGLAANQVHEPVRACVIEVDENPRYPYKPKIPLTVLINPIIEPITADRFDNFEGCLSVPNLRGVVSRHVGIRLRALDRTGAHVDHEVWGLSAGTYQHEVDHLDGRLFVDRVEDPTTLCTIEHFARHHQAKFVEEVHRLVQKYGA